MQWVSWPQLHKYDGVENIFLSFYLLQQTVEICYYCTLFSFSSCLCSPEFTQYTELVNCYFYSNVGTALVVDNTDITLAGNSEFTHNRACGNILLGGAIIAVSANPTFTGNTTFLDNSATSGQCPFGGYPVGGGAIVTLKSTALNLSRTNNFINNSAGSEGGAIYTKYCTILSFNGTSHFINNSAPMGGAIMTTINNTLTINGTIYFTNNGHYGEGVNLTNGYNFGGGVFMGLISTFSILPNTTVYWDASLGGAIYVYDVSHTASYCSLPGPYRPKQECFFQLPGQNLSNGIDVQLVFKNNSADDAGSELYGGAIDNCKLTHGLDSYSSGEVFDMIFHIEDDSEHNTTSLRPTSDMPV